MAPEGDAMLLEIEATHEALEDVGTEYLDEYYKRATKRKTNSFRVNGLDIINEWNRLADQRRYDSYMFDPKDRGKY